VFKKSVIYKDFQDEPQEHTEDLYFHLTVPEFTELQFDEKYAGDGGFGEHLLTVFKRNNNAEIWVLFTTMIMKSYGRRTEDGIRFVKKAEFLEEFVNSPQHEAFLMWLLDNPTENTALFWNGIVPEAMNTIASNAEKYMIDAKEIAPLPKNDVPTDPQKMTRDQLVAALQNKAASR
jgi:hypothetical protein